jgi:tetratricopeptide (TPR) repeat protein
LHAAGRFADAMRMYARAYATAERGGNLLERARASNNLGNAARDLGQYAEAQLHFTRALELWHQTGDVECIAGARNNLGNLAMSQGDFTKALEHHRESLSICSLIGNVQGAVLAQAKLAILSIEQSDGQGAIATAKEALISLGDAGHMLLRGLIHVVLGEGHLECGDVTACQEEFDRVLKEFDEPTYPLVVAGALRGLGRAALLQGSYSLSLERLDRALGIYESLKRDQEAARTRLYRAEALWRSGDTERARRELERARKRFRLMQASRDAKRADQLLHQILDAS